MSEKSAGGADGARPLAFVVGAGGMAMAIASRLGRSYRLLIADKDPRAVRRGIEALAEEGCEADGQVCDITDPDQVRALADRAGDLGPPDALAHVVGLSPSMGGWSDLLAVNLVGATRIADAFENRMRPGGAAVFVSSMAGHMALPTAEQVALLDDALQSNVIARLAATLHGVPTSEIAYSLSKFALIRMCERRAAAWGRLGLRIVSLSPGMIATPMGKLEFARQPLKQKMLEASPVPREGTLGEIADAVEFLLSDSASFITGTDLLVDGGVTAMRRFRDD